MNFYLELKNNTIEDHFKSQTRGIHHRAMEEVPPRIRVTGGKWPWSLEQVLNPNPFQHLKLIGTKV